MTSSTRDKFSTKTTFHRRQRREIITMTAEPAVGGTYLVNFEKYGVALDTLSFSSQKRMLRRKTECLRCHIKIQQSLDSPAVTHRRKMYWCSEECAKRDFLFMVKHLVCKDTYLWYRPPSKYYVDLWRIQQADWWLRS